MPPLEKRIPTVVAVAGTEHGRRGGHLVTDPASELGEMPVKAKPRPSDAVTKQKRLRRRRASLKAGADTNANANVDVDVDVDGRPIQRLTSTKKNVVLNTRNRFIIWLANNELHVSVTLLAIVHGFYWLGYEWPLLWISMNHKAKGADDVGVGSEKYVRGVHDFKFVFYWIVQLIAIRSRKQRRFGEMGWTFSYICVTWTIGFKVWMESPYYMNTANLYANYPDDHIMMPYGLKWFYLVQAAFWLSNVYTIHVEERRKDHVEMLTHHVATIVLVLLSYTFHFTRFGHAFMLIMDLPDIFLTSAKMFRYLEHEVIPNALFGIFSLSWVATKHVVCLKMMISIWTQGTKLIPEERRFPHYPNSYASYPIVSVLWVFLCVLQVVLLYWFYLLLRVLNRVLIKGENVDDNRSDDEGSDNEDDTRDNAEHSTDSGVDINEEPHSDRRQSC
ncbi:LAG1-domain-containing protein [Linderina pennispora]|uniref:LAG1-domain-containing protein n=1 Tax=Linderina pennispora TaxID=61395 RepID=A0A1Y1WLQ8_9FUNG|nr:LAG1-domain-containing protein [Linderina pennispora]ORX74511.1 LAG1-domain-containing protein [Linderina pennispora]